MFITYKLKLIKLRNNNTRYMSQNNQILLIVLPLNPKKKKKKILRLRNIYRKGRNHQHWVERFK